MDDRFLFNKSLNFVLLAIGSGPSLVIYRFYFNLVESCISFDCFNLVTVQSRSLGSIDYYCDCSPCLFSFNPMSLLRWKMVLFPACPVAHLPLNSVVAISLIFFPFTIPIPFMISGTLG